MNNKIIEKKVEIKDGAAVIVETVEKTLSTQDLINELNMIENRQSQIKSQVNAMTEQYNQMEQAKCEVKEMLNKIKTPELEKIA